MITFLMSVNSLGLYKYAHYCTWSHMIYTVHSYFN
jgi:hypothetical protein